FLDHIASALTDDGTPRELFERAVTAQLSYISANPDGFRVLIRDAPSWHSTGSLASLMSDIATKIENELSRVMSRREIDPRFAPIYAQMLIGMAA
ncbi:MAG TPA: TetR family transcriptional regulator, partial [Dermacoccus sp.]|nr:TetR family transcriptional regulator [Dermacoccus sp.]